ncbi:MAG: phosphatase PAP2 family protein [Planctomycetota bacterium]|nr:phosphatase PAP2 family protein [Planctomycetota bacterium]
MPSHMSFVEHKTSWTVAGHLTHVCLILLSALVLAGCGTLPNGRRWGHDAFSPIDFDRISRAAHDAFFDLNTLIPLTGAAIFAVDDFDERVSDWAVKHTPVFGSGGDARDASDDLVTVLGVEAVITAFATPSGDVSNKWIVSKAKGGVVELAAVGATNGMTSLLKSATDRTRPDKSSNRSFPSAHTSSAFSFAALANRNLDSIHMPRTLKPAIKAGNLLLASCVGWARVEGQKHYPSDVLAGAALGHFLTAFIHDAFLNLPENGDVDFGVFPVEGGAGVSLSFRF